jgi:hypothetical protein
MNVPSPLLDRLAQLLVLYEHLRIETFAVTESAEESIAFDALDARHRMQNSIRRFADALLEFDCALSLLSQTDEYRSAEANFENDREMKNLMATVCNASRRLDALHETLRSFGSSIGEQRGDEDANIEFRLGQPGGGAQISDIGQSAAPTLARSLPATEVSRERIKDALNTIRDGYAHATQAIHALVAAFVGDRL